MAGRRIRAGVVADGPRAVAIHRPYFIRANTTLQASQGEIITPEIAALLADRRERAADVLDYIVIVLILFDMVVKPFSWSLPARRHRGPRGRRLRAIDPILRHGPG